MQKTIHLLLTHYSDRALDYERFFYDNREPLASAGIVYPWLDKERNGFRFQGDLNLRLRQLTDADSKAIAEFNALLYKRDHLLLVAPIWLVRNDFPAFMSYLRDSQDFPEWKNASLKITWLAYEESLERESSCFYNFPADTSRQLYQNALKGREASFAVLDRLLSCADECVVIPDTDPKHVSMKIILDALGLDLPVARLAPLRQSPVVSRLRAWLMARIGKIFPLNEAVREIGLAGEDNFTFMEPRKLKVLYDLYAPLQVALAQKYGVALSLPKPSLQPGWKPFSPPALGEVQKVVAEVLQSQTPAEKDYSLRLLANAWNGDGFLEDPAALAANLYEKNGLAQPEEPVLCVLTLTKNHEKYIGECIESVLAQKTSFPVRHIILDDASTDNTSAVIEKYARLHSSIWPIFLPPGRNRGENISALFKACKSEYAALCDGDDYFTDPLKLQKQVDFLESRPECAVCFHPVDVVYEDGSPSKVYPPENMLPGGVKRFYTLKDLFSGNMMQTNSVVYRWRFRDGLPAWFNTQVVPSDWYWHLLHAENGLIGYLPDHMSVYRRHGAALFATAEKGHVTHRNIFGMSELYLYNVLDEHFRGRFRQDLQRLANGVFADFLQIYMQTDNPALLNEAVEKYPGFGSDFLRELKLVQAKHPARELDKG